MTPNRFLKLPLLTKILLSTSVALTILFAITGQIVLTHIRRTVSDSLEEEVQIATPYHLPTVQLLEFADGPAAGRRAIRFCHYDTRGRFQRSPLIVDEEDIDRLAKALTKSSKLRTMLAALTSRRRA